KTVKLKAIRDKSEQNFTIKIAELKEEETAQAGTGTAEDLGLTVQTLTPEVAENLGLDRSLKGVIVTQVDAGGPAADAGLRRGSGGTGSAPGPRRKRADENAASHTRRAARANGCGVAAPAPPLPRRMPVSVRGAATPWKAGRGAAAATSAASARACSCGGTLQLRGVREARTGSRGGTPSRHPAAIKRPARRRRAHSRHRELVRPLR